MNTYSRDDNLRRRRLAPRPPVPHGVAPRRLARLRRTSAPRAPSGAAAGESSACVTLRRPARPPEALPAPSPASRPPAPRPPARLRCSARLPPETASIRRRTPWSADQEVEAAYGLDFADTGCVLCADQAACMRMPIYM
ncbi:hypothetical protein U9M48_042866 [Paspalum notatum var. saurae]|uniref:Uncharacterized protein n=1 Tax=Paspalum notatum var. saurae TaxID=547442 RepID=A0AAQ3XFV4_PASNO